ncbi:zinc-binding metallopeptidase family protein [Wenzhouxiangella marina]|uniref:Uncharacterized protein n=1 Tax=Wenzhouxiangella marina TaxID=1579979 RepID=A0A0K0XYZ4_9GAMM|nr:putative zinc-binding peptidase [Wenzhouxiangella marina]AKS42909.1 hypothetical protein WM2015_2551 [Wenzhouxiangella marina]MBB6087408.1 hypothetical protein [Wenzhouxiangella marina]
MKTFRCVCGNRLYFENTDCLQCGRKLGFLPGPLALAALEPAGKDRWTVLTPPDQGPHRFCRNSGDLDGCNWMIPVDEPEPYCLACRLNQVIPNLSKPGNRSLWIRIEKRKRRLVYDLRRLALPVIPKRSPEDEAGLAFAFLEDDPGELEFSDAHQSNHILTGHAHGLITINIAEADDLERERRRHELNEQQRTLLGHFRHESGHYYWDRLVAGGPLQDRIRAVFGDEREDYGEALSRYYRDGPRPDWQDGHVSAYASAHPWEDWAECWAHWLQITDTLETSVAIGLAAAEVLDGDVDERISHWVDLALKINLINRSLDQPDPYPFVLTTPVIDKLRLVEEVIRNSAFSP